MQLALIKGRATSTVKHASLNGQKLLVCRFVNGQREEMGDPVLVLDHLGARTGDQVMVTSDGLGLRQILGDDKSPARWWTLGIVDD